MVGPQSLMNPDSFLRALGDFPASWAADSSDAIATLWYVEAARALDQIFLYDLSLVIEPG